MRVRKDSTCDSSVLIITGRNIRNGKFTDVSKAQILVPMEILACGLVELDIESNVDTCEELSKDELPVSAELLLSVWVGPENHH